MIESISISNYALIDNIELSLSPGFNIITGETGAGKSIMLGALSMLLGNRADTKVVTDKTKKSIVEAVFDIGANNPLRDVIAANDLDWENGKLIIRREISPSGRSRSFINDSPVSLSLLNDITRHLVDLHSQHQNQLLATPEFQLAVIDTLLPDKNVISEYQAAFKDFRNELLKYKKARREYETSREDEEYLRFQLEKLAELHLSEGETAELENERDILENFASFKNAFTSAISLLTDEDNGIVQNLKTVESIFSSLTKLAEGQALSQRLEALRIEASDIADTIEDINAGFDLDPSRLEFVNERLSDVYSLMHKHKVDNADELIAIQDSLAGKLALIDNSDERLKLLAAQAKKAKLKALDAASKLTESRRETLAKFAEALKESAVPLGMKNLLVDISLSAADLAPTGADDITFRFAFNKNQAPLPVKDTASGGEVSRLMLAIKSIIAGRLALPTIIFDEIDTGVSGDVANRMGELMQRISTQTQVIAITHLPQVAAQGNTHYKVYKQDDEVKTYTHIERLTDDRRLSELALMLSGNPDDHDARITANSLLKKYGNI